MRSEPRNKEGSAVVLSPSVLGAKREGGRGLGGGILSILVLINQLVVVMIVL